MTKFVTKERWRKAQGCIRWLAKKIGLVGDQWSDEAPGDDDAKAAPIGCFPHKQAEKIRGFLIYVSWTYRCMVPYLKGLHLTLEFWRPNRNEEGWRKKANLEPEEAFVFTGSNKAPRFVKLAPRLKADVQVLMAITAFEKAPQIHVRARCTTAAYLVGEASGSGFVDCLWLEGEEGLDVVFGSWDGNLSSQSSNFWEGYNLVLRLEDLLKSGKVKQTWDRTLDLHRQSGFGKRVQQGLK